MDVQGQTCRSGAGESRAHWEGETLVIDTRTSIRARSLRARARTCTSSSGFDASTPDHLVYEFTVDDRQPGPSRGRTSADDESRRVIYEYDATKAITACRDPERRAGDREEGGRKPQLAA